MTILYCTHAPAVMYNTVIEMIITSVEKDPNLQNAWNLNDRSKRDKDSLWYFGCNLKQKKKQKNN